MVVTHTVLIVDDEASLRQSLSMVLKSSGYRVTTASSAAEASQFLKAGAFDLVFLDLKMPEVDGLTLLREIRRLYPHMAVLMSIFRPNVPGIFGNDVPAIFGKDVPI